MVIGDVVAGLVRAGDRASTTDASFPVAAVEIVTHSDRRCDVALGFRYSDAGQLAQPEAFAATEELDLGKDVEFGP